MLLVHCLFDYNKQPPRPLMVGVYDSSVGTTEILTLYFPRTGKPLTEIIQNCEKVKAILESGEVILSDFKSFISGFNLDTKRPYQVYDMCLESLRLVQVPTDVVKAEQTLRNIVETFADATPEYWQYTIGRAQLVYHALERRGVTDGINIYHPIYGLTFSGRSKTSGFNIQGTTENDIVRHVDHTFNTFICLDWIAADMRVAGLLSGDQRLNESFADSDPYTYMVKTLDDPQVTRDMCKRELISSLYALAPNNPMLDFYDGLKSWMEAQKAFIEQHEYAESLFGRRFHITKNRTVRSVFNAIVQGSVAHAMQMVIARLYESMGDYVLTEIHDSVILACEQDRATEIVNRAVDIMSHPLQGAIEEDPVFPLRVSVGLDWRRWQPYKVYR